MVSRTKTKVESFTLPPALKEEISVIPKTGYYSSSSEFIRDAVRTMLNSRKDLRMAVAVELYREEKISLGRAAEILGVGYEEMKKILMDRDIALKRGAKRGKELRRGAERLGKLVK